MKKGILFIAPYPTDENIKDGMISRVNAIDQQFTDIEKAYLEISITKNLNNNGIDHKKRVYSLNLFLHFFLIVRLLYRYSHLYLHSVWECEKVWIFLPLYKGKLILDAHGVVPEEIFYYDKQKQFSNYMNFVEKATFKKAQIVVCVTEAMKKYFKKKHPSFKGEYIVYSIYPHHIERIDVEQIIHHKIKNKIRIIYSGGVSPWQNIDKMLHAIKKVKGDNIEYQLLVNDKEFVLDKVRKMGITSPIEIDSVLPQHLKEHYLKADYAFILRDDTVVNNVASPTKMIEYLNYGIIPITLSDNIGDYKELGYVSLPLSQFNSKLEKPTRADIETNLSVVHKLINQNKEVDFPQAILAPIS
ncbi:MAG: hypothetical protein RR386_02750 [Bacteroidaceae bacterium]